MGRFMQQIRRFRQSVDGMKSKKACKTASRLLLSILAEKDSRAPQKTLRLRNVFAYISIRFIFQVGG